MPTFVPGQSRAVAPAPQILAPPETASAVRARLPKTTSLLHGVAPRPARELSSPEDPDRKDLTIAKTRLHFDFTRIPVHTLATPRLQTKLTVNHPGDEFEQEADRIADQVMRTISPPGPASRTSATPSLQRKCACGGTCASCQKQTSDHTHKPDQDERPDPDHGHDPKPRHLQRKPTHPAPSLNHATAPPLVHEVLRSPGHPLDPATRAFMEPRFGHDFSHVRVHTDQAATASARAVQARAYTVGHHIAIDTDFFSQITPSGKTLLAHELTHVLQQSRGATAIQRAPEVNAGHKTGLQDVDVQVAWAKDESVFKDRLLHAVRHSGDFRRVPANELEQGLIIIGPATVFHQKFFDRFKVGQSVHLRISGSYDQGHLPPLWNVTITNFEHGSLAQEQESEDQVRTQIAQAAVAADQAGWTGLNFSVANIGGELKNVQTATVDPKAPRKPGVPLLSDKLAFQGLNGFIDRALRRPGPKTGYFRRDPETGAMELENESVHEGLTKAEYRKVVRNRGYRAALMRLRDDIKELEQDVVNAKQLWLRTSSFYTGQLNTSRQMEISDFVEVNVRLHKADVAFEAGDLSLARTLMAYCETDLSALNYRYQEYVGDIMRSGKLAVKNAQMLKAAGQAAAAEFDPIGGFLYNSLQEDLQQEVEVSIGARKSVDRAGILKDSAVGAVIGKAAGLGSNAMGDIASPALKRLGKYAGAGKEVLESGTGIGISSGLTGTSPVDALQDPSVLVSVAISQANRRSRQTDTRTDPQPEPTQPVGAAIPDTANASQSASSHIGTASTPEDRSPAHATDEQPNASTGTSSTTADQVSSKKKTPWFNPRELANACVGSVAACERTRITGELADEEMVAKQFGETDKLLSGKNLDLNGARNYIQTVTGKQLSSAPYDLGANRLTPGHYVVFGGRSAATLSHVVRATVKPDGRLVIYDPSNATRKIGWYQFLGKYGKGSRAYRMDD